MGVQSKRRLGIMNRHITLHYNSNANTVFENCRRFRCRRLGVSSFWSYHSVAVLAVAVLVCRRYSFVCRRFDGTPISVHKLILNLFYRHIVYCCVLSTFHSRLLRSSTVLGERYTSSVCDVRASCSESWTFDVFCFRQYFPPPNSSGAWAFCQARF